MASETTPLVEKLTAAAGGPARRWCSPQKIRHWCAFLLFDMCLLTFLVVAARQITISDQLKHIFTYTSLGLMGLKLISYLLEVYNAFPKRFYWVIGELFAVMGFFCVLTIIEFIDVGWTLNTFGIFSEIVALISFGYTFCVHRPRMTRLQANVNELSFKFRVSKSGDVALVDLEDYVVVKERSEHSLIADYRIASCGADGKGVYVCVIELLEEKANSVKDVRFEICYRGDSLFYNLSEVLVSGAQSTTVPEPQVQITIPNLADDEKFNGEMDMWGFMRNLPVIAKNLIDMLREVEVTLDLDRFNAYQKEQQHSKTRKFWDDLSMFLRMLRNNLADSLEEVKHTKGNPNSEDMLHLLMNGMDGLMENLQKSVTLLKTFLETLPKKQLSQLNLPGRRDIRAIFQEFDEVINELVRAKVQSRHMTQGNLPMGNIPQVRVTLDYMKEEVKRLIFIAEEIE
jgi:hypothetical protein